MRRGCRYWEGKGRGGGAGRGGVRYARSVLTHLLMCLPPLPQVKWGRGRVCYARCVLTHLLHCRRSRSRRTRRTGEGPLRCGRDVCGRDVCGGQRVWTKGVGVKNEQDSVSAGKRPSFPLALLRSGSVRSRRSSGPATRSRSSWVRAHSGKSTRYRVPNLMGPLWGRKERRHKLGLMTLPWESSQYTPPPPLSALLTPPP